MIDIPRSPVKDRNERIYGDNAGGACIVCSKPINTDRHKLWVRILYGCYICTAAEAEKEEAESPGSDTGYYPVGKECIKRFPQIKPYVEEKAL